MKLFLKKVLIYIVTPIIVCHLLFVILYFARSILVDNRLKKIAEDNSIMIMGDSQMTKISPEYFDSKAYNIATPGEHYYFTLSKLQKLVSNPDSKIECVLLGLSVHNFAPLFVNHFSLNTPEGKGSLRRYLLFFNIFDSEFVRPPGLILNKEFFLGAILGPEWGGFKIYDNGNPTLAAIEDRVKDIFDRDFTDDLRNSTKQEYYLSKIAELCKKHKINLVLISNPVHNDYKSMVDKVYFEKLSKTVSNYDDLLYINFLKDSVPGSYLQDPNHINRTGSEIYSKKINSELARNNLIHHQLNSSTTP